MTNEESGIPTGFRPPAQVCEERATLRKRPMANHTTPTGLRPMLRVRRTKTNTAGSRLLGFELRKEDHIADAFLAEQHHAEAIDADADAAGWRHAMFEGDQEIFVELLLLAAGL